MGGGIFWFKPAELKNDKRVSEISTFFTASQNEQYSMGITAELYFLENRLKIMENFEVYKQPNLFWGLGYISLKKDEEEVLAEGLSNRTSFLWLFYSNLYFGGLVESKNEKNTFSQDSVLGSLEPFKDKDFNLLAFGLHLIYDTRSSPFFPVNGTWFELRTTSSNRNLASEYTYNQAVIDYRFFHPIWFGHVLALNFFATVTRGSAPWVVYPRLGGQFQMRGYYYGRYIDEDMYIVQVDYRIPAFWCRLGLVLFTGIGDVKKANDEPVFDELKISYGVGLRLLVDQEQQINMRLDFGFNKSGELNFYFTFKEAF